MAERARANFADAPFDVDVARFDDWEPAGRTFDLLFSATAFHWVDPTLRWAKAASVLRPNGSIALATNQTVAGATFTDLYQAARDLHASYASEIEVGLPTAATEMIEKIQSDPDDIGKVWHAAEPKGGLSLAGDAFNAPVVRWYEWETTYNAADARTLLSTYSQYLRLPADRREPLLAGIEDLVRDRFGGHVTRRYLAVLAVAQRRP